VQCTGKSYAFLKGGVTLTCHAAGCESLHGLTGKRRLDYAVGRNCRPATYTFL